MAEIKQTKSSDDSLDWIKDTAEPDVSAEEVSGDIVLEGALGIAEAEAMHQQLSEVLNANIDISIESEKLVRVDAAGAQLLYAFVKEAKGRSLTVTWKSVSNTLLETLTILGLSENMALKQPDV